MRSLQAIQWLVLSLAGSMASFAAVAPPYEVATWRGFKPAAISYTFDDGCPNQFTIAVPMFNARGYKLTLFTVTGASSGLFPGWSKVQTAAGYGHEIASHTVSHSNLSTLTNPQQSSELTNSQNAINANVSTQRCVTLAYPYCVLGTVSAAPYYIGARGCSGQLVPSTPADFMNISSFVCGPQGSVQTPADFNAKANSATNGNQWCVYLIHAIDNDNGYSPLPSATLQASLDYLSTNQNRFWVEAFGNVVRYIRERNAATAAETFSTENAITLQVTDGLDDSIFNYPLTLRRPLPANWPAAAVSQNGKPCSAQLVTIGTTNYVMFDAVPDSGPVVISRTALRPLLRSPTLGTNAELNIYMDGQAGVSYAILSSSDLESWVPLQTNLLLTPSTNLNFPISNVCRFYRAQWVPW